MTNSSSVVIETTNASRYLQQLCKHWQHSLDVTFDPSHGRIVFPRDNRGADWPEDAVAELEAHENALQVRLRTSAPGQLEGLKGAMERHLDRFAFREAPLAYHWRDDPAEVV